MAYYDISGTVTSTNITMTGDDFMRVHNGGTVIRTTMNGGSMYVSRGGTANSTTVRSGALMDVSGGLGTIPGGVDDVLLQKGTYFGAWLVQDGSVNAWMGLGDLGDVAVEQIADYNTDGVADLRIRTAAGDIGTQLVIGEDNLSWKYYGSVGAEWSTGLAALN